MCAKISDTLTNSRIPNCWTSLGAETTTEYHWILKTGTAARTGCLPSNHGRFRYSSSAYECEKCTSGVCQPESDTDLCDLSTKPIYVNNFYI